MKKVVLFLFYTCWAIFVTAQSDRWRIIGQVVDSAGTPLSGATILLNDKFKAIAQENGAFELSVQSRPSSLGVRLLGFMPYQLPLDTLPWTEKRLTLVIVLSPATTTLTEAIVSSSPIQVVFEEHYSKDLLDFKLVDPDLVLLLLKSKRKTILQLITETGVVRAELKLPIGAMPHSLHHCCTGTYHVVGERWAWELILKGENVDTLGRYPVEDFYKYVEPCQAVVDGIYFFRKMGPFGKSIRYTWVDAAGTPRPLVYLIDHEGMEKALRIVSGFKSREGFAPPRAYESAPDCPFCTDPVEHYLELELEALNLQDTAGIQGMAYYSDDQMGFLSNLESVCADSLYAPMFVIGDMVYLFNHPDKTLMRLKLKGDPSKPDLSIKEVGIQYQLDKDWKKQILVDAQLRRAYGRFLSAAKGLTIKEIDIETGSVNRRYAVSDAPYLAEKYQIREGNLYFIGQPDVTIPNQRLYKVDLFQYRSN